MADNVTMAAVVPQATADSGNGTNVLFVTDPSPTESGRFLGEGPGVIVPEID